MKLLPIPVASQASRFVLTRLLNHRCDVLLSIFAGTALRKGSPLIYRALLITTLFCGLSPCLIRSADAQKLEKLIIGYPAPVASLGIVDVMRKAGLFKKNGLDVDLVYIQGSPVLTTAMVSGQVPLSFIGGAAIVASAVGGAIRAANPDPIDAATGTADGSSCTSDSG